MKLNTNHFSRLNIDYAYLRNGFRVLDPGGGTRGAYFMSEQLNHTSNSEIVYVDFSKSSMAYAQLLIQIRKTSNVVWVISWIEAIPLLGLGQFDFASCTGVLHHLKSPQKGLNVMKDVQVPNGGANLMVYGKYGRTGIYQLQQLFKVINRKERGISVEISNAKKILYTLPNNHPWFSRKDKATNDDDIEIYDLLLHKRDVAYSISSLHGWVENSNYHIINFALAKSRAGLTLDVMIPEQRLQKIISQLGIYDKYWILDILAGHIRTHEIYISKNVNAEANLFAKGMTIFANGSPIQLQNIFNDNRFHSHMKNRTYQYRGIVTSYIEESGLSSRVAYTSKGSVSDFVLPLTNLSKFIFTRLTSLPTRPRLVLELMKEFRSETKHKGTDEILRNEFQKLFLHLRQTGIFYFKHKSVGLFPKTCCFNKFKLNGNRKLW